MKKKLENAVSIIIATERLQHTNGLLDHVELNIFHRISVCVVRGLPVTVGDILRWDDIASAATLHKRITSLREKKLIEIIREADLRCKQITLTNKGERYLIDYSQIFVELP